MTQFGNIQGRSVGPAEIDEIRSLLDSYQDWTRTQISVELCTRWNLRRPDGGPSDMACRNLLLKLHRRGLICLPPARHTGRNDSRNRRIPFIEHARTPISVPLQDLEPLSVTAVNRGSDEERLFNCLVSHYHYLGLRSTVGRNMKYLIHAYDGRPLVCVLFGSAAWRVQSRDNFIAWNDTARERNLQRITNNTRFLILPWVQVRCLASRVLSLIARRIRGDWESKYGHAVDLLETFVDTSRFRGTCYRAANWRELGVTSGRSRNSVSKRPETVPKAVFILPLHSRFRRELCQ